MADYHVKTTGNDSNDGAEPTPWLTIQHAADTVVSGDTVTVWPGTYAERVTLDVQNVNTTWSAQTRRTVYMLGFVCINSDTISIDGFNITNTLGGWREGGVWVESDDVTVNDCYFYDIPGWAVQYDWSPWPSGGVISNCHVFKCQNGFNITGSDVVVNDNNVERLYRWDSGDDVDYTRFFGDRITFKDNWFHGTLASEIGSAHVDGFQTFYNGGNWAHDCVIERNLVESFHQGVISEGDGAGSHTNLVVRNNIFVEGDIATAFGVLFKFDTEGDVYNNTFINLTQYGVAARQTSVAAIKNNIFYNIGLSNYWKESGATIAAGTNLIYPSQLGPDYVEATDIVGSDPLFVDAPNGDYRLLATSPCIGAGTNGLVTVDFNGQTRSSVHDIGAHEFFSLVDPARVRMSVINHLLPLRCPPFPGGGITQGDRQHLGLIYAGILIANTAPTGPLNPHVPRIGSAGGLF